MKLKINYKQPITELDHVVLTMLLWLDIWKHKYKKKQRSKYWKYVCFIYNWCPLCNYYLKKCKDCFLNDCRTFKSFYAYWSRGKINGAKEIYFKCKEKARELIDAKRYVHHPKCTDKICHEQCYIAMKSEKQLLNREEY